jgi:3-dehydroquinate dehydratase/shikimate dehydrogenase
MAQIIASMFARSHAQVVRQAALAAMAQADWLELRLDRWPRGESLAPVLAAVRLPVLVTCRSPEEGGHFRGTLAQARELLTHALDCGAQGIDLDLADPWSPPAGRTGLRLRIRSFHSFTGVPKELAAIRDRLHAHQGCIAKIVVTAHDLADAAPVLELLQSTDQRSQPTVAFAMGRTAWPTRVLAAAFGAPLVYGSIEPGEETAPGQMPVGALAGLYRVHGLGAATSIYGLLGNPALQSLGPWLHNRVFRRLGLDAVYLPFETSRPESVVAMLGRRGLRGLSVTAPHKPAAAALCHHLDDEAKAAGVVNTIVAEAHGLLVGHNTDQAGVRIALERAGVNRGTCAGRRGVVLGTGGAARAGAMALRELGCAVTMLGRSLEPVRDFARVHGLQLGSLSAAVLDELQPAVVVHATPVGSAGPLENERVVPDWTPAAGTVVLDMVYQPRLTRLLREAAAAGAAVVPGVEMFLGQAQAQVRWFTGAELPIEALRPLLAGTAAGASV